MSVMVVGIKFIQSERQNTMGGGDIAIENTNNNRVIEYVSEQSFRNL